MLKFLTSRSVNGCLTMAHVHDKMKEVFDLDEEVNNKIISGLQSAFYTQSFLKCTLEDGESRDDD